MLVVPGHFIYGGLGTKDGENLVPEEVSVFPLALVVRPGPVGEICLTRFLKGGGRGFLNLYPLLFPLALGWVFVVLLAPRSDEVPLIPCLLEGPFPNSLSIGTIRTSTHFPPS